MGGNSHSLLRDKEPVMIVVNFNARNKSQVAKLRTYLQNRMNTLWHTFEADGVQYYSKIVLRAGETIDKRQVAFEGTIISDQNMLGQNFMTFHDYTRWVLTHALSPKNGPIDKEFEEAHIDTIAYKNLSF